MAKFRVNSIEERTDGKVACDTVVLNGEDVEIGHFTVILDADEVNAASGTLGERTAVYLALFSSDARIAKTVDSEAAVAKMNADVSFPVTVEL